MLEKSWEMRSLLDGALSLNSLKEREAAKLRSLERDIGRMLEEMCREVSGAFVGYDRNSNSDRDLNYESDYGRGCVQYHVSENLARKNKYDRDCGYGVVDLDLNYNYESDLSDYGRGGVQA